jgi:hypothetical protein
VQEKWNRAWGSCRSEIINYQEFGRSKTGADRGDHNEKHDVGEGVLSYVMNPNIMRIPREGEKRRARRRAEIKNARIKTWHHLFK